MTKYLTYQKIEGGYKIIYENGAYLGDFLVKEDGYYDWWPRQDLGYVGCWAAYVLREMADKLDELNAPWDEEINKMFESEKT